MSKEGDSWASLDGLRVLLVEDDPLICLDFEASLADLGAVVAARSDVASGLRAIAEGAFDFAVLDFDLGIATCEPVAQAARARRIPFLFLSGYGEHDARFDRWSGIAVLAKPI